MVIERSFPCIKGESWASGVGGDEGGNDDRYADGEDNGEVAESMYKASSV